MTGVQYLSEAGNSSLCHCIQASYGAHPTTCPMSTGGSFLRGGSKKAGP